MGLASLVFIVNRFGNLLSKRPAGQGGVPQSRIEVKPRSGGGAMVQPTKTAAGKGERMIEIKVRFWTNDIADTKGDVIPRHAWSSGVVRMEANHTHGIKPKNPAPFNSLLD